MKIGIKRAEKLTEAADAAQSALEEVQSILEELLDEDVRGEDREDLSSQYVDAVSDLVAEIRPLSIDK